MSGPSKDELVGGARSISLDVEAVDNTHTRPQNVRHISTPAYETPLRHHQRKPSTPRHIKETLHARSEWSNSGDDGSAIHKINQYMIKEEIGRGSFGAVHLAVDQYGQEYAVKEFSKSRLRKRAQSHILRRPHGRSGRTFSPGFGHTLSPQHSHSGASDNPIELIREEIAIMKKINHPNLVSLLEVLDDPEEDSLYMVLEMCKKGVIMKVAMHEPADPYDDESCRCWFRDLILGIEYLHAQGVAHRDIKPDNLLLTEDDELKIVDFGVSEMFEKSSDSLSTKSAGSPAFLPPELCVTKHGNISGKAADIWSMGVTLYCLAFGHVPFEKTNILELYASIRDDPVLVKENISSSFRDVIYQLLEKDPEKRIKMEDLRVHPWVTRSGEDPLMSTELNVTSVLAPPTREEMNRAITKNMGNLLVVIRAVKQFKRLLYRRRPELFRSILGSGTRMVEPPMQMTAEQLEQLHPSDTVMRLQTRSQDAHDRRAVEGKLATEGVTRAMEQALSTDEVGKSTRSAGNEQIGPTTDQTSDMANLKELDRGSQPETRPDVGSPSFETEDSNNELVSSSAAGFRRPPERFEGRSNHPQHPQHPHHRRTGTDHEGKGQAHDPLRDTIYLGIGASGDDGAAGSAETAAPLAVSISESPSADDTNIYEKAYEQELARIRKEHGRHATFYLTRRVDSIRDQLQEKLKSPTLSGVESQDVLRQVATTGRAAGKDGLDKAVDALKGLRGKLSTTAASASADAGGGGKG